jgi:uncharacterized protein (TIGR02145 family)
MENSENKSLISTGSSNLAQTEKLLAITQKLLSEIKPHYESVRIGNQEWLTRNLDMERFQNGDLVPHIESDEDWEKAGQNEQPAWCYYDNDSEYGKDYGKLYNWYAVNDPRGLAPEGWHIPTDEEWTILEEFLGKDIAGHKLKSVEGWEEWENEYRKIQNGNGDNSIGFNVLPGGYRNYLGSFFKIRINALFWSTTKHDIVDTLAWSRYLYSSNSIVSRNFYVKSFGVSVRCLRA